MTSHPAGAETLLARALAPWRRRLMLLRALRWGARGLAVGSLAAVLVLLAGRVWPVETAAWASGFALFGMLLGLAYGAITAPPLGLVARRTDRAGGLADRVATAWELRDDRSPLAQTQRTDALRHLGAVEPDAVFPLPGLRRELGVIATAGALVLAAFLIPNPITEVIQARQALQEDLEQAAAELEKQEERVTQRAARPLTDEEQTRIAELLEEAQQALKQAETLPEALEALSRAEEELDQLDDPADSANREALDALAAGLPARGATADLKAALSARDVAATEQALDELARELANLSEDERRELMEALQEAANEAGASGPQGALAGQLRAAARAAGSGTNADAELAGLAAALSEAMEGEARAGQVEGVARVLRSTRNDLSASVAARGSGQGQAQGQNSGQGQGQGSGQGQNPGQGQGTGQGQGQVPGQGQGSGQGQGQGSGQGSGSGQGGTVGGTGAGGNPQGTGSRPAEGQGEQIFVPGREGDGPVQQEPGGSAVVPGVVRPYREVVGEYAQTARDHVERTALPPALKDYVREYFAALQGAGEGTR